MTLELSLLVYVVFGFVLMDYMCPFWEFFEKMVGAIIWPIALSIGIFLMLRRDAPAVVWQNVVLRGDVMVNGEARQNIIIDLIAPENGLFLVTVDPRGKELTRVPVPTK